MPDTKRPMFLSAGHAVRKPVMFTAHREVTRARTTNESKVGHYTTPAGRERIIEREVQALREWGAITVVLHEVEYGTRGKDGDGFARSAVVIWKDAHDDSPHAPLSFTRIGMDSIMGLR